jgi:hypothetical protein
VSKGAELDSAFAHAESEMSLALFDDPIWLQAGCGYQAPIPHLLN